MERRNNTRALVETAILTAISVILILANIYLPIFFVVGLFIMPVPIAFVYVRNGAKYSILSLVVSGIITALFSDPMTAISLSVMYGFLGVILGYCIATKKKAYIGLALMSFSVFISTIVGVKLLSAVTGIDIISQVISGLQHTLDSVKVMLKSSGAPQDQVDKMMKMLPTIDIFKMIVPAWMILSSISLSFFTYLFTQKIFKRFKYSVNEIKSLAEWYIPTKLAYGIIAILVITFIMYSKKVDNGAGYFMNAQVLFSFVFSVNGVATVYAFLKKRSVPMAFRVLIVIFCMMPPISFYMSYLGIFDYMIDYRKLDPFRRRPIE